MDMQDKLTQFIPLFILFFALFLLVFPSIENSVKDVNFGGEQLTGAYSFSAQATSVSACHNLTKVGETYVLTADVNTSQRFCFVVQNDSITLDCNGHRMNGSSVNTTLVQVDGFVNFTLKDCTFFNATTGLNLTFANKTMINNSDFLNISQDGVLINGSNDVLISNVFMAIEGETNSMFEEYNNTLKAKQTLLQELYRQRDEKFDEFDRIKDDINQDIKSLKEIC